MFCSSADSNNKKADSPPGENNRATALQNCGDHGFLVHVINLPWGYPFIPYTIQRLHLESGRIACFSKCQFPYGWSERIPYSRWCVAFNKYMKTPLINSPVRSTISQNKACQVQYCVLRQLLLLSPIWYNMVQFLNFLMVDLREDFT